MLTIYILRNGMLISVDTIPLEGDVFILSPFGSMAIVNNIFYENGEAVLNGRKEITLPNGLVFVIETDENGEVITREQLNVE